MSELPIIVEGQLAADAGAMVLGAMLYPKDLRSARQFAALLWEETVAKAASKSRGESYGEGQLFRETLTAHNFPLLGLVGHMALRIARGYVEDQPVSKSVAAHIEAERFSTTKTIGGQRLPTDRDRLRRTFDKYAPVVHLWGASAVVVNDVDGSRREGVDLLSAISVSRPHLLSFLGCALCLEETLRGALPDWCPMSVPWTALEGEDLSRFRLRLNAEDPRVAGARSSYKSRSGM
ncbi:hypothetical protein [Rubellimicrobium mesophilum]|uniref:hypothetical protein n=1 Tax=Rubellimicrobium mesophilum TaxID=1123067 RepID=UPI0005635023|nr:hypothetical protein [Rubellimicrobium mesophilum]